MLTNLLNLLRQSDEMPSAAELCRRLEVTPEILQSMFDILVRKGKLSPDLELRCGGNASCSQTPCPGPAECELVLLKPIREIRFAPASED